MPEDMDIYMKKIKQRADETDNVMGKIKADKMAELDKLRIDNEMEEVRARLEENRAKIRESQQAGQALAPQQAYNFAELLFAGRPPEEIKQIIASLTEEEIHKLAYMASAMNNNKLSEFREYMRQPSTSMKEVVEAIKIGTEIAKPQQQPQGSISDIAKSMAEMFKTGVEIGRGQAQPTQQTQDPMQIYKVVAEIVRPFQDEAHAREKEANELRYKALESKIINPSDYVKNIKAMASDLGLSAGGTTELDLKKEEMKQNKEIDMEKISIAREDLKWKRDNEGKTIEQVKDLIKTVGEGPIGKAIENIGGATGDRIRSGKGNSAPLVKAQCPKCGGVFGVNPALPMVTCVHCGEQLAREQPSSQQVQESQNPQVTQQESQASEQPAQSADQKTAQ